MRKALDFGHPAYSYYQFAAGVASSGVLASAQAAHCYGLPLAVCLAYLKRYAIEGYTV